MLKIVAFQVSRKLLTNDEKLEKTEEKLEAAES
jgi:hypothetical protein